MVQNKDTLLEEYSSKSTAQLTRGTLSVEIHTSTLPPKQLYTLASRRNHKRPWLFVSRVLGRHLPVSPSKMQAIHKKLAAALSASLPGPVLMIGMAETAICLGQGVHEEYVTSTERNDILFMHSTRYHLNQPLALTFEEQHSHATHHRIYEPSNPNDLELFNHCQSLVIIDDESSTGQTFINLINAFADRLPNLQQINCMVITEWMSTENRQAVISNGRLPTQMISILDGSFTFCEDTHVPAPKLPNVIGNGGLKDTLLPCNYGRFGLREPTKIPPHVFNQLRFTTEESILVLGTGEFVYLPYLLARHAEEMGANVRMQATTRSPILLGGEIRNCLEFMDAYEDGIPNFIYSVEPGEYDQVWVCYETPPKTRQIPLLNHLNGQAVYFSHPVHFSHPRAGVVR